jgi:hypothetical protein
VCELGWQPLAAVGVEAVARTRVWISLWRLRFEAPVSPSARSRPSSAPALHPVPVAVQIALTMASVRAPFWIASNRYWRWHTALAQRPASWGEEGDIVFVIDKRTDPDELVQVIDVAQDLFWVDRSDFVCRFSADCSENSLHRTA